MKQLVEFISKQLNYKYHSDICECWDCAMVRHICYYLLKHKEGLIDKEIAYMFNKNRTTVLLGRKKIEDLASVDVQFCALLKTIVDEYSRNFTKRTLVCNSEFVPSYAEKVEFTTGDVLKDIDLLSQCDTLVVSSGTNSDILKKLHYC